jgi:hypothetical protein
MELTLHAKATTTLLKAETGVHGAAGFIRMERQTV